MTQANTPSGAEKATGRPREGSRDVRKLLAMPGTRGAFATSAVRTSRPRYLIAGDTAAAAKSLDADSLANPSAYEYQDLLNSAVTAARANQVPGRRQAVRGDAAA